MGDPGYTGGAFKRFFASRSSAREVTTRRVLEDIVVAKLPAGGVEAVPAWQSFAHEGRVAERAMTAAVDSRARTG